MGLPVLSCSGCGKCCETIGTPPFVYLHPSLHDEPPPDGWGEGSEEYDRWGSVPPKALSILADYYAGQDLSRSESGLPCLWYDEASKGCRFYDHRPDVCREFEMGGEDCLRIRKGEETCD